MMNLFKTKFASNHKSQSSCNSISLTSVNTLVLTNRRELMWKLIKLFTETSSNRGLGLTPHLQL